MPPTVTADIQFSVTGQHSSVLDLGTVALPFALSAALRLTTGTGASMADRVFTDTRTLLASATEDLDLAAVLVDALGVAITFAKIKAIFIKAAAANTNDVQVTRPASNGVPLFLAAGDGMLVKPGGFLAWALPGTGITVTAATGDLLTFTNSAGGTPVTYDVVIIGTSA
jgi:hypothetical protein